MNPQELWRAALDQRADLVICRIPAAALPDVAALQDVAGPTVVADTLVHYWGDLTRLEAGPLRNSDLEFVAAGAGELESLVRQIFPGYANHYFSNPILPPDLILEGYVEWATGFVGQDPGRVAWIVRRADRAVAFATCRFDREEADGILYGVLPSESGRGIYRDLIRFTSRRAFDRGCRRMHLSTQVHNYPVQAVWAGEGFRLKTAEVTFHLNALLETPGWARHQVEHSWDPLDLPGDATVGAGWAVDGVVGRFLRGILPNPGVKVTASRHCAVRPLRGIEQYRFSVAFPRTAEPSLVVVRVDDAASNICHVAYYSLGTP